MKKFSGDQKGLSISLAFVLLIFSGIATAADVWSGFGRVTGLMYYDNKNLHIWADMPRADPYGCGGDRYVMPATSPVIKETYAGFMLAFATAKTIRIYVLDQPCTDGNPTIRVMEVR